MKAILMFISTIIIWSPLQSKAADTSSEQKVIEACKRNKAYLTWMDRCKSNPSAQAACYCAAAALIRCYMTAAPTHPSIGEWKKAYKKNMNQASELGSKCFDN